MLSKDMLSITPPLKWAGGKRWLIPHVEHLIPDEISTYYEPFFGGGALFFSGISSPAVLSDLNLDLIRTYRAIQVDYEGVEKLLRDHSTEHSDEYYYKVRSIRPIDPTELAAWFLYLNRTCFNGLYRVNRQGAFNVPRGDKTAIILPSDNFKKIAEALDRCDLVHSDFEPIINRSGRGDFVFVDPPYTVKHNNNGFIKYNENIFSWNDQERLARAIGRAASRGVRILVSNADHPSIRELYEGMGSISKISRHSVIGGSSEYRSITSEMLISVGL